MNNQTQFESSGTRSTNGSSLKIILACSQFPPTKSGYARHAFELAKGLTEAGHDVKVITENQGCARIGKVCYLTSQGKKILDGGCDIVQVIGPSPLFTDQCVDYAVKRQLKVVYAACAIPGLASYYYNPFAPTVDWMYEKLRLRRTMNKIDLAIFNTGDYAASCSFYSGPYAVIPHGVTPCPSDLCNSGQKHNGGTEAYRREGILFVGQLRRYKGIAYLLDALKKVRDIGLETNLTIVGDGPDGERLRRIAERLGVKDHVSFLGKVEEGKLHELYSQSRVLVLPSIGAESFGIVLLEASAHGLPVIASSLAGVREITWELGGIPVPPKDSDALARAVVRALASSPYEIFNSSHNGTIDLSRFSWKRIALTYLKTYEKILQRESPIPYIPLQKTETITVQERSDGNS